MKKIGAIVLCALALQVGVPAQAMFERAKSYAQSFSMPKVTLPSLGSMPKMSLAQAQARLKVATDRFMLAVQQNKKAVMAAAAAAIIAALTALALHQATAKTRKFGTGMTEGRGEMERQSQPEWKGQHKREVFEEAAEWPKSEHKWTGEEDYPADDPSGSRARSGSTGLTGPGISATEAAARARYGGYHTD